MAQNRRHFSPALDFFFALAALTGLGDKSRTRRARTGMTKQRASVRTRSLGRVHETAARAARTTAHFPATVGSLQTIEFGIPHFSTETQVAEVEEEEGNQNGE